MKSAAYKKTMRVNGQDITYFDIQKLAQEGIAEIARLPYSIRILVENLLRKLDGQVVKEDDLRNIAQWQQQYDEPIEIPYHPARVLMQDFTGVPAVVDLAAMRDAVKDLDGDPKVINPLVPVDLIVDHSIQVDAYGTPDALRTNVAMEYQRNGERYALLKWAQKSFDNFRVVPPNSGICHQVNLEYLGQVVMQVTDNDALVAYPDTLVGTDSHTTMIDAIGVMGWGVGGIEAEAVMLGQPYYMSIPQVIGVKLTGVLAPGVTATDLVLTLTELLRQHNAVEKFVEYFGPGLKNLSVPIRATIANMTPEYGATMGFFPVDGQTIEYLRATNREAQSVLVERYTKAQGLFHTGSEQPDYSQVIEFDLATVVPCVAGPARPQDRIALSDLKKSIKDLLSAKKTSPHCEIELNGQKAEISHGSIVIAAITSCTNTSNPYVMLGAALLARNAVAKGLQVPPHVKTSLAPGSKVVVQYLRDADLMSGLEALGFHLAAFGCTTCIGNSGPLHPAIEKAIAEHDLTVASILSGNRNFEARIHQSIRANYLASPPLVVALALAGRIDIDLTSEALGVDGEGASVYLKDIWPSDNEVDALVRQHVKQSFYKQEYDRIFEGDEFWHALDTAESTTFKWDAQSTYIKKPPYFENFSLALQPIGDIEHAKPLVLLGDSVTTDHISPAGAIPPEYPAGEYLIDKAVTPDKFNSYGSRRGNHEVMMRGTFGNIRIKNLLVKPKEGSWTLKLPEKHEMSIYAAAMSYAETATPLIVLSGSQYGTGSSRDWAAKGTKLLGVKAVIAESFERIHRSNLVGMGVLPLVFTANQNWQTLGLTGFETFFILGIEDIQPRKVLQVTAVKEDSQPVPFEVLTRLDTDMDLDYFLHGGILPYVLRKLVQ